MNAIQFIKVLGKQDFDSLSPLLARTLFSLLLIHQLCADFRLVDRPRAGGEWRRHLGHMDEGDLFMELIRDVSNELDIDVLCHKILVNVGLLTSADRGSLFLARGPPDNRYLVAKLFDVTVDTGQCHIVFVQSYILLK